MQDTAAAAHMGARALWGLEHPHPTHPVLLKGAESTLPSPHRVQGELHVLTPDKQAQGCAGKEAQACVPAC